MQDAWRAYLELALGLTEASRRKAEQVVKDLLGKGGATAAQIQGFADELVSTSRANREGLVRLVRHEVDRALGVVGLATADEVAGLTTRVRQLERQLRERDAAPDPAAKEPAAVTATPARTATKSAAGRTAPKKVAKKKVAKKTVAKATKKATAGKKSAKKAGSAR